MLKGLALQCPEIPTISPQYTFKYNDQFPQIKICIASVKDVKPKVRYTFRGVQNTAKGVVTSNTSQSEDPEKIMYDIRIPKFDFLACEAPLTITVKHVVGNILKTTQLKTKVIITGRNIIFLKIYYNSNRGYMIEELH